VSGIDVWQPRASELVAAEVKMWRKSLQQEGPMTGKRNCPVATPLAFQPYVFFLLEKITQISIKKH
jgi:hypothetical protein